MTSPRPKNATPPPPTHPKNPRAAEAEFGVKLLEIRAQRHPRPGAPPPAQLPRPPMTSPTATPMTSAVPAYVILPPPALVTLGAPRVALLGEPQPQIRCF